MIERLPKPLHACVRKALRQAWRSTTPTKPSGCCATLPGGSKVRHPALPTAFEGLDEMLTVNRLGLPLELRRAYDGLHPPIENMMGTVRRPVATWKAGATPRWRCADRCRHDRGRRRFRRLKAYKQLPGTKRRCSPTKPNTRSKPA